MFIGEFVKKLGTTKDAVRHYEDMHLLNPKWDHHHRVYGSKEIEDFQIIKEMQALGLTLKEIQTIFILKSTNGCGNSELIDPVIATLQEKQSGLAEKMETIKQQQAEVSALLSALETYQSANL